MNMQCTIAQLDANSKTNVKFFTEDGADKVELYTWDNEFKPPTRTCLVVSREDYWTFKAHKL